MITKDQVKREFTNKLQALLDEYMAELEAEDHYQGYPECGEDIRMTVMIPAQYDNNHDCTREFTEIDLGQWMYPTSK